MNNSGINNSDTFPPIGPPEDLPPELISIARQILRDCRAPGQYALNFTISPHKSRIQNAQIVKLDIIRILDPKINH